MWSSNGRTGMDLSPLPPTLTSAPRGDCKVMYKVCEQLPDQPLCEAFADVLVAQVHQNLMEEKIRVWGCLSALSNDSWGRWRRTFPRRPLCLDSRLPAFFTATSRVLLWSSMRETVNSKLRRGRRRALTRRLRAAKGEAGAAALTSGRKPGSGFS